VSPVLYLAARKDRRDGLCERKFRDRSLQEIAEQERRWEFATTTPGMTPIQALELVRAFAKAIQESTPEAQREVVQRVFQRIAITDDRVTDVDVYQVYAEALRWYWRPQPDNFRTRLAYGPEGLAEFALPSASPNGTMRRGVAQPEDDDLALASLAARNNAEWCDIFCRSHGVTGTFHSDAWASPIRTPARYPDAVALDRSLSGERILSYVDSSRGCSIKDSFGVMDLSSAGFRVLFEAEWIVRPPQPAPKAQLERIRWEMVREPSMLRTWEGEWARDAAPTGFFLPVLLRSPDVVIMAGYSRRQLVAGAIFNRSPSAVGLSNVFSSSDDLTQTYEACVSAVANHFPGMPIVGYEAGEALAAAHTQGFQSVGRLAVWLKE